MPPREGETRARMVSTIEIVLTKEGIPCESKNAIDTGKWKEANA
jgi:hypothetical protein